MMTILQENAEDTPDFDDQYDDDFAPDLYAEEPPDLDDLYDDDFASVLYGDIFSEDAEMLQEYAEMVRRSRCQIMMTMIQCWMRMSHWITIIARSS
ncbi:hypothetical protein OROGR_017997 [Orobanche gracilis]